MKTMATTDALVNEDIDWQDFLNQHDMVWTKCNSWGIIAIALKAELAAAIPTTSGVRSQ